MRMGGRTLRIVMGMRIWRTSPKQTRTDIVSGCIKARELLVKETILLCTCGIVQQCRSTA
jgi:hypothetical protein